MRTIKRFMATILILLIIILASLGYSAAVEGENIEYNPDNIKQARENWDVKNVKLFESESEIEIERAYSGGSTAIGKILSGEVRWDAQEKTLTVQPKGEKKAQFLFVSSPERIDVEAEKITLAIKGENKKRIFNVKVDKGIISLTQEKQTYKIECKDECKLELNADIGESYYEEKLLNSYIAKIDINGEGEISKKDSEENLKIFNLKDTTMAYADDELDFVLDAVAYSSDSMIGELGLNSCLTVCSPVIYGQQEKLTVIGQNFKVYNAPDNTLFVPEDDISTIKFGDKRNDILEIRGDSEIIYSTSGCKGKDKTCVSIGNEVEIAPIKTGQKLEIRYFPTLSKNLRIGKIKNDETVRVMQDNGYGQMTFSKSEVEIVSSNIPWYEFDTSFTAEPYLPNKKDYGTLICNINTQKCTLDGNEIQGPTELGAKSCKADKDCDSGKCHYDQKIDSGFCVQENKCKELEGTPQKGPINVVIIAPYDQYKNEIGDVTKIKAKAQEGVNKMFAIDPYSKSKGKFSFSFLKTEVENMEIFNNKDGGVDYLLEKRNELCPSAEIVIGMIDIGGRSFALQNENVVVFYKHSAKNKEDWYPFTFVHEISHIFGLADEYMDTEEVSHFEYKIGPNCIASLGKKTVEERAAEVWSKLLGNKAGNSLAQKAAANGYYGCGGCANECLRFLRPSENSIMNNQWEVGGQDFNSPSIEHIKDKLKVVG
ncbi:MAG: hypothetical protein ABIB71_01335 [Candidatus Woesearchaeota archaeon]